MLCCVKSVPNSQDDQPPFGSHFDPTWGYISLFSTTYMWDPQVRLSSTSDCYTHRPPLGVAAPCAASAGASREAGAVQAPCSLQSRRRSFIFSASRSPRLGRSAGAISSSAAAAGVIYSPFHHVSSPTHQDELVR